MENLDPKETIIDYNERGSAEEQKYVMANSVYIINRGAVLMLQHTKAHSVTGGRYIGIGGKYALKSFSGEEVEKIPTSDAIRRAMVGDFKMEDVHAGVLREIYEETAEEIDLKEEDLEMIGCSHIIIGNEIWNIGSYIATYDKDIDLDKMNEKSKEGVFKRVNIEDVDKLNMWPADKIILNNRLKNGPQKENIYVEAIYEKDGNGKLRYVANHGKNEEQYSTTYILIPDLKNPTKYAGETLNVDAKSLEATPMMKIYANRGNNLEKFMEVSELKTLAYLDGVKSNISKFEWPEHSEKVDVKLEGPSR